MAKEIMAKKLAEFNLNQGSKHHNANEFENDPSQSLGAAEGTQYLSQVISGTS